jgi:hypothetical protein
MSCSSGPSHWRGATYDQLARIAYLLGIDKHERNARKMWYRIARDVMLSEAHADHIIGGLKAPGNPNRVASQLDRGSDVDSVVQNQPNWVSVPC